MTESNEDRVTFLPEYQVMEADFSDMAAPEIRDNA